METTLTEVHVDLVAADATFHDYLDERSWLTQSHSDREHSTLRWYPSIADIAPSGDLGFTSGPWTNSDAATGAQTQGDYVTVWQRGAGNPWRVAAHGRVAHGPPAVPEPELAFVQSSIAGKHPPPASFLAEDVLRQLMASFLTVAQQDGAAAALRCYGRNDGFRLLISGEATLAGPGPASAYLADHQITGVWREAISGRSADSTFAYATGRVVDAHGNNVQKYLQVWEYDPKVSTWACRILLCAS